MSNLIDQSERDRFVKEQGRNISVIAPAGVGKTTAIVNRIVHLARLPEKQAVERLSRLVVVTYSVRAAQQMQQKARVAIREARVSYTVQRAFQQAFFGTIHSHCVRLLDRFGHYLGLPSPVGLLETDEELWQRFLLRGIDADLLRDEDLRGLFDFYAPEKLYSLGKQLSPGEEIAPGPLPPPDLKSLLDYNNTSLHPATRKSIVLAQKAAQFWSEAWARGDRFRPLPSPPPSAKAAEFAAIWRETFEPLHDWLRQAALAFGRRVANAYERYRLSEAMMTYDDQVRLAGRVLALPEVQQELATEHLSVLLDEAQDTDPRQFEVLRRIVGLGADARQTDDQTFCIVGDFQQAIYAPRSDLMVYRQVHDEISAEPRGTVSRLQVTFRCDAAIIDFVNQIFPSVLHNAEGQSRFEPLFAREEAGLGRVVRWTCPNEPSQEAGEKISAHQRSEHEAGFVAERIKELGLDGLGASAWSQVAILCPRKDWLVDLHRELDARGLPVQLHSSSEPQRYRTPTAWLTALIWIAAHPDDTFEIAGVLREILGVSDSDMALFTRGNGTRLRLDRPDGSASSDNGPVEAALGVLREACANAETQPLHLLVRQLLDRTQLRERLNSILDLRLENPDRELDDFLALIAEQSAGGATLAELADNLRRGLDAVRPEEEEILNAIQLMTSHKSKGLEWQTVIVPFVFRRIESKAAPYPRVVQVEGAVEMVCRDRVDFETRAHAIVERRERQQLQRLLYVMSTRAKRTLVFVDDEMLFAPVTRKIGSSAAELLGFIPDGENRPAWEALPESAPLPVEIAPAKPKPLLETVHLPELSRTDIARAVEHAGRFPRRTTPHALAIHAPLATTEAEPEQRTEHEDDAAPVEASHPGILYGTWWHEFVQTIPWHQPQAAWQRIFAEAQARSPQPDRSAREWELFLRSELARWLAEPGRIVQVELPFLWRESDAVCLEGIMDLAVYSESESGWRVIDWKTNRVGTAGSAGIVGIYRGQIEAYTRALGNMLGAEVRGSLYLTETGAWEPID